MPTRMAPKIRRALISVSNKDGLVEFATGLSACEIEIYSSGGTSKHLQSAGFQVHDISAYTGFPEMMSGRLKTLHPKVAGGILCRHDVEQDATAMAEHGIVSFELVVVNLYPFEETVAQESVELEEAIEQIDIGGPTLIRAAAKNHAFVTIASDPSQYEEILQQVEQQGATTEAMRRDLAGAAFAKTARYEAAIANYFAKQSAETLPSEIHMSLVRRSTLRYGENPHQLAALYAPSGALRAADRSQLVNAEHLHGKELSYNNLLDLHSALTIVRSLPDAAAVVIKHNNPCGAAADTSQATAVRRALDGDATSAFGSVLGFNQPVTLATADVLVEPGRFIEAIVAPNFEAAALETLTSKPKWKSNVRLLKLDAMGSARAGLETRHVDGGLLVQESDVLPNAIDEWRSVTQAEPSDCQQAELEFAWTVCRNVKSNAIVICKDRALIGVGAGQMSRVDAVEIALRKAGDRARGSVLASDAFFPFDDSIHRAAEAGITALIQPGGSRRDDEVIAACDKHGLAMIFTGRRHFKH